MNETAAQIPLEVDIAIPELSKGEREYRAFLHLLPELLRTHAGQFVAIHQEKVIDHDRDDIVLVKRVHAKIGYVPIHVGLVVDPPPIVRVPHYRAYPSPGKES